MVKIAISFNSEILPKWDNLSQLILLDGENLASLNKAKSEPPSKTEESDIKSKERAVKLKPEISQDTTSTVSNIDKAIEEFRQSYANPSLFAKVVDKIKVLERILGAYMLSNNNTEEKNKAAEAFIEEWNNVKREIKRASSMVEVDAYMTKVAMESITNWIGKKKLERNANTIQLSIYNNSNFIKDELDHLMNSVEDGFDFSEIKKTEEKIKRYLSIIQSNLLAQKSLITGMDSKVLLDNLGNTMQGITDSQKERIDSSIRMKKMRDLYNKVNL